VVFISKSPRFETNLLINYSIIFQHLSTAQYTRNCLSLFKCIMLSVCTCTCILYGNNFYAKNVGSFDWQVDSYLGAFMRLVLTLQCFHTSYWRLITLSIVIFLPKYFLVGVYIKLKGQGFVKFSDKSDDEEYLDRRIWVFGNGADIKLPVGQHTYPFNFILPFDIPSSFRGNWHIV
jgi:hypothetical protein